MDLVEEEEAAMAVEIMAATEVAAMAVEIMAATEVAAMAVEIMAATEVAAMAVEIMDLIALTLINLLEQKVGRTEVMEILLITLNMKMVGSEEKGGYLMRAMLQTRQISNPSL
ncbi:hypothetical protein EU98_0302 [Prochlorococcus marinus str. MIT 9314]|uniref:Uncharacterized protein n=1 Tax=Prochlorococcus marinus str. MIT 9314 TaxID=167548 RepID=A0A0A2ARD0_PROMR|nr:hypothetical protein EU98_0302 [Prochlorococcus marinus str. MIT 9314]